MSLSPMKCNEGEDRLFFGGEGKGGRFKDKIATAPCRKKCARVRPLNQAKNGLRLAKKKDGDKACLVTVVYICLSNGVASWGYPITTWVMNGSGWVSCTTKFC